MLFLDEPTTGLDPEARAELWAEVRRLTGEGLTILLTTHYLEEADRLAGQVAIIDRGRIVGRGHTGGAQGRAPRRRDRRRAAVPTRRQPRSRRSAVAHARRRPARARGRRARPFARAPTTAPAVPAVLAALDAAASRVASVTVARPSLDDVYLRHTGRAYRPRPRRHPDDRDSRRPPR